MMTCEFCPDLHKGVKWKKEGLWIGYVNLSRNKMNASNKYKKKMKQEAVLYC